MNNPIHTSDIRHFRQIWKLLGGWVEPIRRTENSATATYPCRIPSAPTEEGRMFRPCCCPG